MREHYIERFILEFRSELEDHPQKNYEQTLYKEKLRSLKKIEEEHLERAYNSYRMAMRDAMKLGRKNRAKGLSASGEIGRGRRSSKSNSTRDNYSGLPGK